MTKLIPMNLRAIGCCLRRPLCGALLGVGLLLPMSAMAAETPHRALEDAVQTLLDEFTSQRRVFEEDKNKLYELVERVAVPLFDFQRISKLVLASHWKQASVRQRQEFSAQFKDLLIRTYATALFKYTGNEKMVFIGSEITERNGRKFAVAKSEVTLGDAPAVAVDYALILGADGDWKIYNLTINGLNMVTNYRNTQGASIERLGLDGMLALMKQANANL